MLRLLNQLLLKNKPLDRFSDLAEVNRYRYIERYNFANGIGSGASNEVGQASEIRINEVPGEIVEPIA